MELIQQLLDAKICGLDTPIFIYLFEGHKKYFSLAKQVFNLLELGKIKAITSVITPIEVLSAPALEEHKETRQLYMEFFKTLENLQILNIDMNIADEAARLRRIYHLRTPDAIQAATAIISGTKIFVTNDAGMKKIKEIKVITLDDN